MRTHKTLTEGEAVCVRFDYGGQTRFTFHNIDKVTDREIIIGGTRYSRVNGHAMGIGIGAVHRHFIELAA